MNSAMLSTPLTRDEHPVAHGPWPSTTSRVSTSKAPEFPHTPQSMPDSPIASSCARSPASEKGSVRASMSPDPKTSHVDEPADSMSVKDSNEKADVLLSPTTTDAADQERAERRTERPAYLNRIEPRSVHGATMEERLQMMPEKRAMPWRPGIEPGSEYETGGESRRKQIRFGCLLATRGDLAPVPCNSCANGRGKFSVCVVLDGYFKGACASCQLSGRPNRCSIKLDDDYKSDHVDVGAIIHPGGLLPPERYGGPLPLPFSRPGSTQGHPPTIHSIFNKTSPHMAPTGLPPAKRQRLHEPDTEEHRTPARHAYESDRPPWAPGSAGPEARQRLGLQSPWPAGKPYPGPPPPQPAITGQLPAHMSTQEPPAGRRGPPLLHAPPSFGHGRTSPGPHGPWTAGGPLGIGAYRTKPLPSDTMENRPLDRGVKREREPEEGATRPLIESLPRGKQQQIYGLLSGLQSGIDHLQRELATLKKLIGVEDV